MNGNRSRSFKIAVNLPETYFSNNYEYKRREVSQNRDEGPKKKAIMIPNGHKLSKKFVEIVADQYLHDSRDRRYYADQYNCCPPPLFILIITFIELSFFIYYSSITTEFSTTGPISVDSLFIFRPDKKAEVWRFLFYTVLHVSWIHLLFNIAVQILVGLPLEMVHGSLRIGIIYSAGVLAGSMATSIFDPKVYLVGASGGVYALLAAHLANVILNYSEMALVVLRIFGVLLVASVDVGVAIYNRYAEDSGPVSYVAHLAGSFSGLTLGIVVLKNFEQKLHEQLLWWIALGVYGACILFVLLFNLFN